MTAVYVQCTECKKFVNVVKPILGSLHVCLSPEESALKRQRQATPNRFLKPINNAAKAFEGSKEQ